MVTHQPTLALLGSGSVYLISSPSRGQRDRTQRPLTVEKAGRGISRDVRDQGHSGTVPEERRRR